MRCNLFTIEGFNNEAFLWIKKLIQRNTVGLNVHASQKKIHSVIDKLILGACQKTQNL
jgi:hypothetical protein